VQILAVNRDRQNHALVIRDNAYGHKELKEIVLAARSASFTIDTPLSRGWYDVSVSLGAGQDFEKRYAGRVETGKWSISDPLMGRALP
jgi:phospholipase C